MFQKIADYTELLLPDNLLRDGSIIEQMITLIPEDDWKDAVQIIGWLYQYYNNEKKDEVFAALKKNVKITKENIPAATQLFTPDWIVRYMVENSLGRLWLEGHPNDAIKSEWKYYLDEAKQEAGVQVELDKIRKEYKIIKPEEIKCIDPCSGSGHILAYMFDVLMKIYEAYGYTSREAATSIVENNIYGLDIDERAAQLANFAVMMKARQYDRRFFAKKDADGNLAIHQPHVYAICESNHISKESLDYFANGDEKLEKEIHSLVDEMYDAKEYGSILNISAFDFNAMFARFDEIEDEAVMSLYTIEAMNELFPVVRDAQIMAHKYNIVVTNPPYMGGRNMNEKLLNKIVDEYPEGKADLYSSFILKNNQMTKKNGFTSMITQHSWMFLSSFDKLRESVSKYNIINMCHLGARAFEEISGEVVQTTTWISRNQNTLKYKGAFVRLVDFDSQNNKEAGYLERKAPIYNISQKRFDNIPGKAFAYWLGNPDVFTEGKLLEQVANPRQGMKTLDNDYYIKFWHEIERGNMCVDADDSQAAKNSKCKWFPINHGGEFRKYYGNNYSVVNWLNDGEEMKANAIRKYNSITRTITNIHYYFKEGITWSVICSAPSFRWYGKGFMFSNGGQCVVPDSTEDLVYLTGLLNSKVTGYLLNILSPTLGFESGYLKKIPVIKDHEKISEVEELTQSNIELCKKDWDDYEISWDFIRHPLVKLCHSYSGKDDNGQATVCDAFIEWESDCNKHFDMLKMNEEELNKIFINIYGLQETLTSEIMEKTVTVRKADLQRDIKGLISYAVGCMFGRYSLDEDGLIFAGGDWDATKYRTFEADRDNIIPICDDEYFEDDIVGRFVKFIKVVYGKDTLQENMKSISDALGGKGQPKEVIRNYFMNDFYNDHCKMYKKRPIYWQFDSGKNNGFKCLIYMHRYQPDTIMRIRTDYVHEQQGRYRTVIADLEQRINSATTSERVKLTKKLTTLQAQAVEIREYEEKIHHLADQMICIDLDDGVKANYEIFKDVLAKIK